MNLKVKSILNSVSFPFASTGTDHVWLLASGIGSLEVVQDENDWTLVDQSSGKAADLPPDLKEWDQSGSEHPMVFWYVKSLLLAISSLEVDTDRIILKIESEQTFERASEKVFSRSLGGLVYCIRYLEGMEKYFSIGSYFSSVNQNHPLTKIALKSRYLSTKDAIQDFATCFVMGIPNVVCTDRDDLDCDNRWKKYIGSKYISIDWSKYHDSLKPPYLVRLRNGKEIVISDLILKEWQMIIPEKEEFLDMISDVDSEL